MLYSKWTAAADVEKPYKQFAVRRKETWTCHAGKQYDPVSEKRKELVLTKVLIYGCVLAGSHFMTSAFPLDFNMASLSFYVQLILKSVVIVSMSFIALFIGLAMKSSKATIISSFLLIFLTQANIGDFTMKNNLIFPVILTFVSLIFAALSVYNVETKDLM